jgi:uncharacterized protein YjbI with pentapeptide repeats
MLVSGEFTDFEGAVMYRCYRCPGLKLPASAVEVEPVKNLQSIMGLDTDEFSFPSHAISECVLEISNTEDVPGEIFSLDSWEVRRLEDVKISATHDEALPPLSLSLKHAFMDTVSFSGVCGDMIIGSRFANSPLYVKDITFQGLELEGEVRIFNSLLTGVDFSRIVPQFPDEGVCIYVDDSLVGDVDLGDLLEKRLIVFRHVVLLSKQGYLEISKFKDVVKSRIQYFGDGAHTEIVCDSPERIPFSAGVDFSISVRGANFEGHRTVIELIEASVQGSDFRGSVLGSASLSTAFDFQFLLESDTRIWGDAAEHTIFMQALLSGKAALFRATNFSNAKLLAVSIFAIKPFIDDEGYKEVLREITVFESCDFTDALLGSVILSLRSYVPARRFTDGSLITEYKELLSKQFIEGVEEPISFKNCNFDGCVSYVQDIREHGGIFFGPNSISENLDLAGRELLAYFGKGSSYTNVNFSRCVFIDVGAIVISDCTFIDCNFSESTAPLSIFQNCMFTRCDFRGIDVPQALFQSCVFEDCESPVAYDIVPTGNMLEVKAR